MHRFAACLALLLCLAACGSGKSEDDLVISTPLPFDPTDQYELATWWSSGTALLYLGVDGYYTIHKDGNRYHRPNERGNWWKHSYAALWLDPYETLEVENRRVAISRPDGELVLSVPEWGEMRPLDGPPEVVEDRLFGRWGGEPGWLELRADLRYVFTARRPGGEPTISVSRHEGRWVVEGTTVKLDPDSPRALPVKLELLKIGGELELMSPVGALQRSGS